MGANPWVIIASAIIQQVFALIWFRFIVKTVADYYLAADKGVRRVEHMVHRYSTTVCSVATLAAGIARSIAILAIVSIFQGSALTDYQQAGMVVAALACINQHQFFWSQRPMPLLLTDGGYEVAAALLASVSCFLMQKFVF
ncbi:hypothetical protein DQ04_01271060 [Trypanosoma grayi]|uniref:hypothetical protein n=1 Tax=Trypanosoma grayi TaxID=71804 RepID=UPI0004F41AEB|nr:hypothetical protein DQ04_01271060 [Trypanosoma grayi]KEG13006.1 hypothetical protein DQ04_01271060 [Trypanosoma grayi]